MSRESAVRFHPGALKTTLGLERKLTEHDVVARMWERDHTLWSPHPVEVLNRLGWLELSVTMRDHLADITEFAARVRENGITHVIVLGMGGASLVVDVFPDLFPTTPDSVTVTIVDSTHPDEIRRVSESIDPEHTMFVLSMKAWALETYALFNHFFTMMVSALGAARARAQIAVVTDQAAWVRPFAERMQFGTVFENDPYVGGRFAALTHVGLVPAALHGVDIARLLDVAAQAERRCRDPRISPEGNVGAWLGGVIAEAALTGRDKLTFLAPPQLHSWVGWVEQLIAESTGKGGNGVLPVLEPAVLETSAMSDDRIFVILRCPGDNLREIDDSCARLVADGRLVIEIDLATPNDVAAQFVVWEFASAVACHLLGVQAFDQPDVEAAKAAAAAVLADYAATGSFDAGTSLAAGAWSIQSADAVTASQAASRFLAAIEPGDYVGIHAYLPPSDETVSAALLQLRAQLQRSTGAVVTVGYGPRFLHSTGQLHKGDGGRGHFLQIIATPATDLPVPRGPHSGGSDYSFGDLLMAQALGDAQALGERGRDVLRVLHRGPVGASAFGELEALLTAATL